ncbi:putative Hybrid PKS-NRPS biosynthetic cluster [Aspergillus tubingensis]|nr:putative Hybrid PKS-NRPS biosynthetic cluster [Aspergillus tubingensis]
MVSFDATQTESSAKGSSLWERSSLPALHPAHRLTVCRASTGWVSCALEIDHALLDGISRQIIYRHLLLAYDGMLPQGSDHVYRDYISYIQKQPSDPVRSYWEKYTKNLEVCLFPKLADYESEGMATAGKCRVDRPLLGIPSVREFCRTNELTLASVFEVAWRLVLRAYTDRVHRPDSLDRQHLRDQASRLSDDQIQALSANSEGMLSSTLHPPRSARERIFQRLWATVLNISVDRIGTQDDFLFELGGDSIQAMRFISLLRREGLTLGVSDIFAWPVLEDQARGAQKYANLTEMEPYSPGSLLNIKPEDLGAFAVRELAPACPGLEVEDIEDILPTTEFQRHFLEHSEIRWLQLPLPMEIDSARLEKACHVLVLLRRLQVQLKQIRCDEDLDAYVDRICLSNSSAGVPWGTPYFQALLITKTPSNSVLLIRCSHAQHDGESKPLIIQDLISAYERGGLDEAPPPSFALYLRHRQIQANPQTYEFWEQYLQNGTMTALSLTGSDSNLPLQINRTIPLPTPPREITMSSLVKAAWAVVLAQVTGQRDVVFGHALNGRDTPIAGVHAISGPCTTISPLRITIRLHSETRSSIFCITCKINTHEPCHMLE